MKRIALIGLITVLLATVAYALIEPKNVNRAIDWVWSGNITTTGDFTMAEATITSATISTSIKVDANGSTVSQINCGTTTIDAGTTGTTVSLTGCTAATRVFVCPTGDTGSAAYFKATPGSGSFIVKSNADPSSCAVAVNWFAIK